MEEIREKSLFPAPSSFSEDDHHWSQGQEPCLFNRGFSFSYLEGEEEESGPVPLRGLAVNQKALFIAGEEDKDTQREKVKDRRRRLERPGSFQLNKQTSQPATVGVRVPKTWVSFKNFRLEDSSQSIGICKNFGVQSF